MSTLLTLSVPYSRVYSRLFISSGRALVVTRVQLATLDLDAENMRVGVLAAPYGTRTASY